jgi:acyl carrier protein
MLTAPTPAQIESTVQDKIRAILVERGTHCGRLSGMEKLSATLGLSSLDLAFLVAELEASLGVDPFAKLVSITSIRSVGDLVRAYQKTCFPDLVSSKEDQSVSIAVKRAQARRARGKRR